MKEKKIKSAVPIYGSAAVWLLLGLICPKMLLKGYFLLITIVTSAAAYLGLSKLFKGRTVQLREEANSGDKNIDAMITSGRAQLDRLAEANRAIPDPGISRNLDRMVRAGEEIFKALERDTAQAQQVRRFMNYYLPTADKLMTSYRLMQTTDGRGENIEQAMKSIENSLAMIADAFEKQMDNLFKDKALDVETDIQVLETMLASDGLIEKGGIYEKKQEQPTAQAGN